MNKAILIGNLTKNPELKATPNGVSVCEFTIAVNDRKGKGEEQTAQFFRISAWRGLGESCAKYLTKGKKVFVSGPLKARIYHGSDGNARVALEVTAEDVEFLSGRNEAETETAYQQEERQAIRQDTQAGVRQEQQMNYTQVEDDDLPW